MVACDVGEPINISTDAAREKLQKTADDFDQLADKAERANATESARAAS